MSVFEKHKRWREITGNLERDRKEIAERLNKATERAVDAASRGNKADYTTANFEREIAEGELRKLDAKAEPYIVTREEITEEWNKTRAGHNKKMLKAAEELLKARETYKRAALVAQQLEEAARLSRYDYLELAKDCGVCKSAYDHLSSEICEYTSSYNWNEIYKLPDHRGVMVAGINPAGWGFSGWHVPADEINSVDDVITIY